MSKKVLSVLLLIGALTVGMLSMDVSAAEAADTEVLTGTLGDNDGFQWTYDEATKTMTVTGEDSGFIGEINVETLLLVSPFYHMDIDIKKIVLQDCIFKGSMDSAFCDMTSVESIEFINCDTSSVTNMDSMFSGCESLMGLDVSSFDTSQVTDMCYMFSSCRNIENLDLSNFDTSRVTDMDFMFGSCNKLKSVNISSFDTSKVEDMQVMFAHCYELEDLDFSIFDTSSVIKMGGMFFDCNQLVDVDISSWDTSNVTSMCVMFDGCDNLQNVVMSGLDVSNVEDMWEMFEECVNLRSVDFSGCNLSKLQDAKNIFADCVSLTTVYTPDTISEAMKLPGMFGNEEGYYTSVITQESSNKTLTKKTLELVTQSNTKELTIGNSQQLLLNYDGITQDVTANDGYIWNSYSDSGRVIRVDNKGVMTGVKVGTAIVYCLEIGNNTVAAQITIEIRTPFSDIKVTDWQYPYVVYAYENNLMSGKGEGKFDMNGNITRSEFVTVLYSHSEKPEVTFSDEFSDVASDDWFANAVTWAKQEGISAGNADGTFGVYNNITREQLVAILYQYALKNGVAQEGAAGSALTAYADLDKVSTWATAAFEWAVENDIIGGKVRGEASYLDPQEKTTRGECATMMMRYVELTK